MAERTDDDGDLDPSVVETAAQAAELRARSGMPPAAAALVAVLDTLERAGILGLRRARLGALAAGVDPAELAEALALLIGSGVVVERADLLVLDPATAAARARRPPTLGPGGYTQGRARPGELADATRPPGSVTLVVDRAATVACAHINTACYVLAADRPDLADHARDAWLRGAVVVVDAPPGPLDWLAVLAPIPVRLVVGVDARRLGEAIAMLRPERATVRVVRDARPPAARADVPPMLAPLVSTTWNGIRTEVPRVRTAALRGSPARVIAAAERVAAGTGVPLHVTDAGSLDQLAAMFAAPVVLVRGLAGLSPLYVSAVAALLAHGAGVKMLDAGDAPLPTPLAVGLELDVEQLA